VAVGDAGVGRYQDVVRPANAFRCRASWEGTGGAGFHRHTSKRLTCRDDYWACRWDPRVGILDLHIPNRAQAAPCRAFWSRTAAANKCSSSSFSGPTSEPFSLSGERTCSGPELRRYLPCPFHWRVGGSPYSGVPAASWRMPSAATAGCVSSTTEREYRLYISRGPRVITAAGVRGGEPNAPQPIRGRA
jgi:hypothetical protein